MTALLSYSSVDSNSCTVTDHSRLLSSVRQLLRQRLVELDILVDMQR